MVKKQRTLKEGFITHEADRHEDVPWGVFGGWDGAGGRLDIHNDARPAGGRAMPAKFSGLRVESGDVMAFYGRSGGGYGDPLDRPAEKVLEDVLDGSERRGRQRYRPLPQHPLRRRLELRDRGPPHNQTQPSSATRQPVASPGVTAPPTISCLRGGPATDHERLGTD